MYKYVVIALLLSGCSLDKPLEQPITINTKCIDGVEYLLIKENTYMSSYSYGYMSVKLNKNSEVVVCKSQQTLNIQ